MVFTAPKLSLSNHETHKKIPYAMVMCCLFTLYRVCFLFLWNQDNFLPSEASYLEKSLRNDFLHDHKYSVSSRDGRRCQRGPIPWEMIYLMDYCQVIVSCLPQISARSFNRCRRQGFIGFCFFYPIENQYFLPGFHFIPFCSSKGSSWTLWTCGFYKQAVKVL